MNSLNLEIENAPMVPVAMRQIDIDERNYHRKASVRFLFALVAITSGCGAYSSAICSDWNDNMENMNKADSEVAQSKAKWDETQLNIKEFARTFSSQDIEFDCSNVKDLKIIICKEGAIPKSKGCYYSEHQAKDRVKKFVDKCNSSANQLINARNWRDTLRDTLNLHQPFYCSRRGYR